MLSRSSSAPALGSLLPSLSDAQTDDFDSGRHAAHHHNGVDVIRRAQSEGNLQLLTDVADLNSRKPLLIASPPTLRTAPSFGIFNSASGDDADLVSELSQSDGYLERPIALSDNIVGGAFSFAKSMDLIQEEESMFQNFSGNDEEGRPKSPPLYLARGLGVDVGFGGGEDVGYTEFDLFEYDERAHDEMTDMEDLYKRMVRENPGNILFLRNYAQFLYQSKRDLVGAEEIYSRVILSDPRDGETLSQYAKIVWELHRDHERASTYFERAVQVSPGDCHVNAAFASFLWETEDEEGYSFQEAHDGNSLLQTRAMTTVSS